MPAIHLFHRRVDGLGGDDLQPTAILTCVVRVIQVCFLLIPLWIRIGLEAQRVGGIIPFVWYDPPNENNATDCRHSHIFPLLLVSYVTASTVASFLSMILEGRIYHWSSIGTPTEKQPRSQHVEQLLELRLVPFTILQALIFITGFSALFYYGRYHQCRHAEEVLYNNDNENVDAWGYSQTDEADSSRGYILGKHVWWVAYIVLLLSQLTEIIMSGVFVGKILWIDPSAQTMMHGDNSSNSNSLHPYWDHHELMEEMWADRCNNFCQCLSMSTCYLFGGREVNLGDYGDVARALADYMETGGVLDVVPSDMLMGFFVLHKIQRKRVLEARQSVQEERNRESYRTESAVSFGSGDEEEGHLVSSSRSDPPVVVTELNSSMKQDGLETYYVETESRMVLSRHNLIDLETLKEGARFARHALAIYTWVLYAYMHPITGVPKLLSKPGCCQCLRKQESEFDSISMNPSTESEEGHCLMEDDFGNLGDNCCQLHKNALLLQTGLEETELVYSQLRSSLREIPYCIFLDHKWQTVVLAIRGTFSLEDCVTDVLVDPKPLDSVGVEFGFDGERQYCHNGVLSCAYIVYRDLQRHDLLDKLLIGEDAKYPNYTLRIVGHSLGGSTAAMLSYMMREKFPTLRCLAYSPPGHSFTWGLATGCQEFCSTFVLDSDLVPRLSVENMENFRNEVLELIGRVKVPKIEVAGKVAPVSGLFCCSCTEGDLEEDGNDLTQTISDMLYEPQDVPHNSEYQQQLERFKAIQKERKTRRGDARAVSLYPPGQIVHLVKTGERRSFAHQVAKCLTCCTTNAGSEYTPVWVNNDAFNEIVVRSTMGTDHFPNRVCLELEGVANAFGLDTTLGSSPDERAGLLERE